QIEIRINIAYCDHKQGKGRDALTELQELSEINIPGKQKIIQAALESFKTGKLSLCYLTKEASCFRPPKTKIEAAQGNIDYLQTDKVKKYVVG
ncbi:hypothetical protein, partial [Salmonella sp. s54836]|uniref:hypothetical protein n=1 Tax=Salmonella sp. s54836 TaxID=3159673 RepID=UPI003980BDD4